ncbi:MAG: sulfur carrier protein ThiS [Wenzhouxiangellaceae bacterium]|nr:sulfur carrier protein ThiS [Wenzhouxiangellaceae bacterium]
MSNRAIEVIVNGQPHPFDSPPSVAELLDQLGLTGQRLAVELNGAIVAESRHNQHRLADQDRIEILQAAGRR